MSRRNQTSIDLNKTKLPVFDACQSLVIMFAFFNSTCTSVLNKKEDEALYELPANLIRKLFGLSQTKTKYDKHVYNLS